MAQKTAVIFGVSSQDGSYMADLLLAKGYQVIGTIRRTTTYSKENLLHLYGKIVIEAADLTDQESIEGVIRKYKPGEVYIFASQSVPADSWTHPMVTGEVTALGPVRVFEAVRKIIPKAAVYQATSREIFGNISAQSANESTPVDANNPYGISKAYAHMMARCYRESYGMFITDGILFNHESPRRSLHFVTRKISVAVACIRNRVKNPPVNEAGEPLVGKDNKLHLGWLDSQRDWGYAKEYMDAVFLMVGHHTPLSFVIGTNTTHSVREFCQLAFDRASLDWEKYVVSDPKFIRPTEIRELKGDYSLAKKELGWEPKITFKELVNLMVDADLKRFS
jgi:GDPmannose 4,6-dehydratase